MHRESEGEPGHFLSSEQRVGEQAEGSEASPADVPVYSGPERRAQGFLVAEILPDFPAVPGREPELDPRR